jgi:DNA-binding LacI/PurR family transcriptional regulator
MIDSVLPGPAPLGALGARAKVQLLKHQRVEAEIRQLAQTLPVGAKLPAERDMAIAYKCNFLTVRKALKQLVNDGTIVRRVGSGTFIARDGGAEAASEAPATQVGIMVHHQSNAYAYRVLQAIAHSGLNQNLHLRSGWVPDFNGGALAQARQFKADGCVALTLPWFPHERAEEVRQFVNRSPLPVSIAMPIPGLEKNCFIEPGAFGLNLGTEDICRYYQALGQERITLIGPDSRNDVFLQKVLTAFVCYTSVNNMPSPCGLVGPGAQAMDQLAERWKTYRGALAVISYDDEHALRFITAMHKIGLSAPHDYRIIGFNDTEASRYSDPPLTTVHQSFDYIAKWLLKSALALAEGRVCQASKSPRLEMLVRSTCGGRDFIDDQFNSRFQDLYISVDENDHSPEAISNGEEIPEQA